MEIENDYDIGMLTAMAMLSKMSNKPDLLVDANLTALVTETKRMIATVDERIKILGETRTPMAAALAKFEAELLKRCPITHTAQ